MAFRRIAKARGSTSGGSTFSGAGRLIAATLVPWYFLSTTSVLAIAFDAGAPGGSARRPKPVAAPVAGAVATGHVAAAPAACLDHPCCCATSGTARESCCCLHEGAASRAETSAARETGVAGRLTYLSDLGCAG